MSIARDVDKAEYKPELFALAPRAMVTAILPVEHRAPRTFSDSEGFSIGSAVSSGGEPGFTRK